MYTLSPATELPQEVNTEPELNTGEELRNTVYKQYFLVISGSLSEDAYVAWVESQTASFIGNAQLQN